ncbi:MAG: hypothetical protein IJT51_07785 [Bacteroidales bacterium]|nr:hypothetical protein [Bacteroidales bacterium]
MKKLFLFVSIVAILFSGCKKKDTEEKNPYVGKYKGTFTTIGTEGNTTKEATITISEGLGENLKLNYVITLAKLADGRYEFDGGNNLEAELLTLVLNLCGLNTDYFEGTIEKVTIDARFTDSALKMTITYQTDLGIAVTSTFNGTKQ